MTGNPMETVRATLAEGDEYCDVSGYHPDGVPEFLRCRSAADTALAQLRAFYLAGSITIEQFEQGLNEIMVPA